MANKIIVKSNELASRLAVLGKVIGSNSMPILDGILIERESATTLRLTATNNEMWISTTIVARGGIDSECVVRYDWLKKLCKSCKGASTITLEYNTEVGAITASTMDAVINGDLFTEVSTYPRMQTIGEDCKSMRISREAFTQCSDSVAFAHANDNLRPIMGGVHIMRTEDYEYRMASTDGRKLAINSVTCANPIFEELSINLPIKALDLIKSIGIADNMELVWDGVTDVRVSIDTYDVQFKLIEGLYPNYMQVFPSIEDVQPAKFSTIALISAINRAINFGSKSSGLVRVRLHNGSADIIGSDLDSNSDVMSTIACEYSGDDREVGVSGLFALECLNHLSGDNVQIYVLDPSRPMIITGAEDTLRMLLMPMQLQDIETPLERALLAKQTDTPEDDAESEEEPFNEEIEPTTDEQTEDEEEFSSDDDFGYEEMED